MGCFDIFIETYDDTKLNSCMNSAIWVLNQVFQDNALQSLGIFREGRMIFVHIYL